MLNPPFPTLDELLLMMGDAGKHLADIEASEGAAGNLSVCVRWGMDPRPLFPMVGEMELPLMVPELAGATFIVSGSGRRLREIMTEPDANLACITVNVGGRIGTMFTSGRRKFERVTSEFNSHLAVHYDQMVHTGTNFHALVHAQPVHLTYLSHVPAYRDLAYLNRRLLIWQPETIMNLPEGIGIVPFHVPGSPELMAASAESLRRHRIVVWAKHGVMARSDISIKRAVDRIEYAEASARYEFDNLAAGGAGEGLSVDEIRAICQAYNVTQTIF
jgi:rhamnulose-1-phosphate aldolase